MTAATRLIPALLLLAACTGDDKGGGDDPVDDTATSDDTGGSGASTSSAGCGKDPAHALGGVQVTFDAGEAADGERGFYLSLPADYDPEVPHALVLGYPGTDWVGEQIQPYLDLEDGARSDEIFVYPDPLWRDFPGWGTYGGWTLGPEANNAEGEQDLAFTAAILDLMEEDYCIDTERVFVTGHSWGGDMAAVVGCFLGDRVTATLPVAANRPYWFEKADGSAVSCVGEAAVWTMFGIADDHFASSQSYAGEFGDQQNDFWLEEHDCAGDEAWEDLGYGEEGECRAYTSCGVQTQYCLYGPETKHQIPTYFSEAAMAWFRSF